MLRFSTLAALFIGGVVGALGAEVVVLRAVRGQNARLPCGQGKVFLDGPGAYVLWLKNDRDFLYRYPAEDGERTMSAFPSECSGEYCFDETSLVLKRVTERDGGVYRCRVHYQAAPSVDYVINIKLVDTPGVPRIYDSDGVYIEKKFIGPISLGSDLTLTCEVDDDDQSTLVYWRRNGAILEAAQSLRPGVVYISVHVRNVTRAELDAHYECLAQNSDVSEPLSTGVVVKMFLPPLSVEIRMNHNLDFEAGQPRVVDCVVVGCVPPPTITWRLGASSLRSSVHKELHDGNYTVSSLTLAPSVHDSNRSLVCTVHNMHLSELYQDNVTINVGYRPVCISPREETLGVVERQAETVTCHVESSPEPYQFSWTFADSRTLYTSVKKVPGHRSRYSSTLTWLPREGDLGPLLCRAINSYGEQKRPCGFMVVPGSVPAKPECIVMRAFPSAVRVQCKKGWDGGRAQRIHLELQNSRGVVVYNASDTSGYFVLPAVGPANMTALVYAVNVRGKSEVSTLHVVGNPRADSMSSDDRMTWAKWLELLAGAAVFGLIILAITLCVKVIKLRKGNAENPDLVPRTDDFSGSFHREPDFTQERPLGTTNITVNQMAPLQCTKQFTPPTVPTCRVLVGCPVSPQDCAGTQSSYYV